MNRIEFMERLTRLLSDLPENERNEALQYYNDYLDDAGVENEQEVLDALGTPEQLAASIRNGLNDENAVWGEFSEKGFSQQEQESDELIVHERRSEQYEQKAEQAERRADFYDRYRNSETAQDGEGNQAKAYKKKEKNGLSTGAWILIIICAVFAAPVLLPLIIAALVVMVVVAAVAVSVTVALLFAGVICIAAGLWAMITAVVKLFIVPAGAMMAVGISLMIIGIGILLVLAMGWLLGKCFPKMFRGCVNFCSGLINRGRRK